MVRYLTLNLKGLHEWFNDRDSIVVSKLSAIKPVLQEVAIRETTPFYDQGQFIADALELKYLSYAPYGSQWMHDEGTTQGGIAILSKWPHRYVRTEYLRGSTPIDQRCVLVTSIEAPVGALHVLNTHLSWEPELSELRKSQVQALLSLLQSKGGTDSKLVIGGDFNASEDEESIQLVMAKLIDSYRHLYPQLPGFMADSLLTTIESRSLNHS